LVVYYLNKYRPPHNHPPLLCVKVYKFKFFRMVE